MGVFNIISLVAGLFSTLADYVIKKKSGAFRRVELDILLMDQSLTRESLRIAFGYPVIDEKAVVVCILPFGIHNRGELSAKNVHFRLIFPLGIKAAINEGKVFEQMSVMGPYKKSDLRRNTSDDNNYRYIDYVFPEIHPKTSAGVEEGIHLHPLLVGIQVPVEVTTKDGIPLKLETHVLVKKATITVELSAENVEPVIAQFDVEVYSAQNNEELNKKIMEQETKFFREILVQKYGNWLPEHKREEFRENFVSKAYADSVRERTIAVMPKLDKIEVLRKDYSAVYWENPEESSRWLIHPRKESLSLKIIRQ